MTNQNAFKAKNVSNINMNPSDPKGLLDESFHALSPRYDFSEECRVSYSLASGGHYG